MTTDEEIQNALLAIYSRLNTIEGKVTLLARAERDEILPVLESAMRKQPLLGQIYLLLDGKLNQTEIQSELERLGVKTSAMTVSRRMEELQSEYGIADLVKGGRSRILRKNREAEHVLNLSKNVRNWLEDDGHTTPPLTGQRRKRKAA